MKIQITKLRRNGIYGYADHSILRISITKISSTVSVWTQPKNKFSQPAHENTIFSFLATHLSIWKHLSWAQACATPASFLPQDQSGTRAFVTTKIKMNAPGGYGRHRHSLRLPPTFLAKSCHPRPLYHPNLFYHKVLKLYLSTCSETAILEQKLGNFSRIPTGSLSCFISPSYPRHRLHHRPPSRCGRGSPLPQPFITSDIKH